MFRLYSRSVSTLFSKYYDFNLVILDFYFFYVALKRRRNLEKFFFFFFEVNLFYYYYYYFFFFEVFRLYSRSVSTLFS